MTEQTPKAPPTFSQNLGRLILGLIRLLLFALIVAIVTAALYFAIPALYRYLLLPVQNNRAAIEHLRQTHMQLREELAGQLDAQRERIAQLEGDLAAEREARSELETLLAQQGEAQSAQVAAQADLAAQLETQSQAIAALEQSADAFDAFLTDLEASLARMEQALASPEAGINSLQRQILILGMQQAILKAGLHLAENNAGRAQESLAPVERALERLPDLISPEQQATLADLEAQLQTVLTAIEARPFVAAQELEILSQLIQEFSEDE